MIINILWFLMAFSFIAMAVSIFAIEPIMKKVTVCPYILGIICYTSFVLLYYADLVSF